MVLGLEDAPIAKDVMEEYATNIDLKYPAYGRHQLS